MKLAPSKEEKAFNGKVPTRQKAKAMFSVKWRFGIVFSLFLSLSFAGLFFVINWILHSQATSELENRAVTVAKSIAASGATPILGNRLDVFNKLVREFIQLDPEVAYIITNLPGRQLLLHNLPEGLPDELRTEQPEGGGSVPRRNYLKTGQRGIREAAISFLGGEGVVRVGISDLRMSENIRKHQLVLIAVMLTAMIAGTVASILFSRRVTRPLIHLAKAADEISSGNMDAAVLKVKSNDEIKMLADAFERMRVSFSIAMRRMRNKRSE